jgi:hypothetical protein
VLLPIQEIENMGLTVQPAAMEISLVLVLPRLISALWFGRKKCTRQTARR